VRYLAPEVIALKKDSKSPSYDRRVDVWALGISVFELLWGRLIPWQQVDEDGYRWFQEELNSIQKTLAGEHISISLR
jgi:serine/threonine protein kinase